MNRKLAMIGASITVGSVMLVTTAFAGFAGVSGYETYKSAFKSTKEAKNVTLNTKLTIKDNDKAVIQADGISKLDMDAKSSSCNFTVKVGEQERTFTTYMQDGKSIRKSSDSDEYIVMDATDEMKGRHGKFGSRTHDESCDRDVESIVDAIAGNFEKYISSTEKADGTKEVSFEMSDSQISPVVNTIASVITKQAGKEDCTRSEIAKDFGFTHDEAIEKSLPRLVSDVRVSDVSVKAQIGNDNIIKSHIVDISLTGKDADGNTHVVSLNAVIEASDMNNTTPDTVDLTGKKVKSLKTEILEKLKEQK